uniref:Methenyltetrahydrofolate cyclohydrolase n=1 Tax=Equus asinus TaxID=9793 RepID=A0A8C4LP42_EQUAS
MNEETRAGVGWPSVTPAESGRGLPSSANHGMLPRLPSPPGPRSWLFLLQSQTGLYWATANGCRREAGPTTRPRYNGAARARASLPARTPARGMAAASFVSTLAAWLLRPAQSCRLRHSPFHLSAVRNEAVVISGRKLAQQIKQEVRQEVEEWVASGNKRPHLSVVLIGENPASHSYVLNKTRAAADVEHIDERRICNAVSPDKDVDGFHVINVGRMCLDQYSMLPATPWGVWEIIKRTGIPTLGKNVVVAGRSKNVGMPIAMLLHTDGAHERPGGDATVTISHRYTPKEQLKKHTILADIVVSAAEVRKKAGYITPVPGGVGPMTVAMLMKNTVIAAKKVLRPEEREVLKSKELGVATN